MTTPHHQPERQRGDPPAVDLAPVFPLSSGNGHRPRATPRAMLWESMSDLKIHALVVRRWRKDVTDTIYLHTPEAKRRFARMKRDNPAFFHGKMLGTLEAYPVLKMREYEREIDTSLLHLPAAGLITRVVGDVAPEQTAWLWYPYIALGTLCMLDGDPGIGKSLLSMQLAANVSQGHPFPDQTGKPTIGTREPATVLLMTREDSVARTLRPRLDDCGADVTRVHHAVNWPDAEGQEQPFTLQHLPQLARTVEVLHPRLVILDPLQSFFGDININQSNQTRPLLDALTALAEQAQCAIMAIRHPAKAGEGIGKALHRGLGSIDIIGAARTGLFIEQYPGDETRAIVAQTKTNLGPKGRSLIFSKHQGHFAWERVTRLTAEDLAGSGRGPHHRAYLETVLWLEKRLEGGLSWPASDIELAADEDDISRELLKRAKKTLGVVSRQNPGHAHAGWTWRLPPLSLFSTTTTTDINDDTENTDATDHSDQKSTSYEEITHGKVGKMSSEVSGDPPGKGSEEGGVVSGLTGVRGVSGGGGKTPSGERADYDDSGLEDAPWTDYAR